MSASSLSATPISSVRLSGEITLPGSSGACAKDSIELVMALIGRIMIRSMAV